MNTIFVILHNIRSVHNVGSAFRTADAAGVLKMYLTGHTPLPVDRFSRKRSDVAKVALGAEESVSWEHREIGDLLTSLKQKGVRVVGVEQCESSSNYKQFEEKGNTAFVFGNEVKGLSKEILEQCDEVIEIPMKGEKESLNVSVTIGIILFSR